MPSDQEEMDEFELMPHGRGRRTPHEPWHEDAIFHSGEELRLMEENAALRKRVGLLDAELARERSQEHGGTGTSGDVSERLARLERGMAEMREVVERVRRSEEETVRMDSAFEAEVQRLASELVDEPAAEDGFDYGGALADLA